MPKIVLSRTRVRFVLGSGYKYQTPAIVNQPINQIQVNYFFWLWPPLRSRSRVDLGEFFSEQGCISPANLRLVYKYHHGLYFYSYRCIDPVDLHCDSGISQLSTLVQFKYGCIDPVDLHCSNQIKGKFSALSKGGVSLDRFIKLPILLIAFIIYLITAISLRPIGIDLDRPYILFNLSFVNLN